MKKTRNRTAAVERRRRERGFTVTQMIVTLAVATVLMSFSVMGIARVRGTMRLSSASDDLTQYLERARQDSIRRHAEASGGALPSTTEMASVTFLDATTYTITMDFDGDGTVEESEQRTVSLPEGVTLPAALYAGGATTVTFDWRGRPSSGINVALSSDYGSKTVAVSENGSISAHDAGDLDGFELAGMPSPGDVPKSEFEGGTDSGDATDGGDTGNGNGKDKKDDDPTDTPTPTTNPTPTSTPTTDPTPDTNPGNGNGNGKDKKDDDTPAPTPAPSVAPTPAPTGSPWACAKNEKPAETQCVCASELDKFGRCK